ncbi:hypothetical protein Tdes44962_MAKER01841 [Teratosphaeria destructans]|uniref:Uncharacterized protein n=1 Tax=Teratosphaeria destructans TaxID=418781 RepID=A0A9W7SWJ4_9PEZI|nr:hypothetical protein Tdes44962_MAKER01841 [Teratosphaeria destructans]
MKNAQMMQLLRCSEEELSELKLALRQQLISTSINGLPAIILTPTELEKLGNYEDEMWKTVASQDDKFSKMLSGDRWGVDLPPGFDVSLRKLKKKISMDYSTGVRAKLKKVKEQREGEQRKKQARGAEKTKQMKARKLKAKDEGAEPAKKKTRITTRKVAEIGKEGDEDEEEGDADKREHDEQEVGQRRPWMFASMSPSEGTSPVASEEAKQAGRPKDDDGKGQSRQTNEQLNKASQHPVEGKAAGRDNAKGHGSTAILSVDGAVVVELPDVPDVAAIGESRTHAVKQKVVPSDITTEQSKQQDKMQRSRTNLEKAVAQSVQGDRLVAPNFKGMIQEMVTIAVRQSESRILARMEQRLASVRGAGDVKEEIKQEVLEELMGCMQ